MKINVDDEGKDELMNRPVEDIIEEVTNKEEWKGKRASKLDLDDFLSLLAEFNSKGIHFS